MSEYRKPLIRLWALSVAFFLAFSGGTSLAENGAIPADPTPNPSEGEVQERGIRTKTGDLDITSVYGRCRFYNSPTGVTLCARKVCYVAKNLGPFPSPSYKATVRSGGLDHTSGNYGPRRPLDTNGPLGVGTPTGERCKEFPNPDFLDPFQPVHFVVVELLNKLGPFPLDSNLSNNTEVKTINYQWCQTQQGNQC